MLIVSLYFIAVILKTRFVASTTLSSLSTKWKDVALICTPGFLVYCDAQIYDGLYLEDHVWMDLSAHAILLVRFVYLLWSTRSFLLYRVCHDVSGKFGIFSSGVF
jgi:hypothetical protein